MSKAHIGNIMGLQGEYILPVNFEDKLFPFYWNTWSRDIHPTIDVSTIVPDNKWGYVLAVEDGTTNLIQNGNFQNGPTNWSEWIAYNNTKSHVIIEDTIFKKALRLQNDTGTDQMQQIVSVSPNTTYTISYYVRIMVPAESYNCIYYYFDDDSTYRYANNGLDLTKIGVWQKITHTFTTNAATTSVRISCRIHSNTVTNSIVDFTLIQVERKDFATSFVNGTRDVGRVQYPKEIFPAGDFTLNMWIAHTGDKRTANNSMKIFALDQDITKSRLTLWNYCPISSDTANRRIIADFGNDSGGTRQYKDLIHATLFVPNKWEMLTVTLNYATRKFSFYRNGVLWTTHTPTVLNGINAIELYNSGWKYSNLLICPRVVSPEEIRIWYDYGKPFYDPYNYTAIYG